MGSANRPKPDRSRQGHRKGQPESSGEMFFEPFVSVCPELLANSGKSTVDKATAKTPKGNSIRRAERKR